MASRTPTTNKVTFHQAIHRCYACFGQLYGHRRVQDRAVRNRYITDRRHRCGEHRQAITSVGSAEIDFNNRRQRATSPPSVDWQIRQRAYSAGGPSGKCGSRYIIGEPPSAPNVPSDSNRHPRSCLQACLSNSCEGARRSANFYK